MQFERLRKGYKKQIIIRAIAICVIGGALTFSLTRAKYEISGDLELAKGTINYKAYDFKIMAMYKSDDKTNYTEIEEMPSEGYIVNEEKSYCTTDNKTKVKDKVKTINGNVAISNLNKNDKCFIWFDKYIPKITVDEIISTLNAKTEQPDFSKVATTDEGVYATSDGMYGGTSYYWRGATTTNYLKFAGYCWRIVRINGDKTIRLIYDGTTCHQNGEITTDSLAIQSTVYNASNDKSYYVGWTWNTTQRTLSGTESNAKNQIGNWFSMNIDITHKDIVESGKYCNERNVGVAPSGFGNGYTTTWVATGAPFTYIPSKRIIQDYMPTLSCDSRDIYNLKVGIITADEVEMAGGNSWDNKSYYLYNGQNYWSMTPQEWTGSLATVFFVNENGILAGNGGVKFTFGLRPVINLRSDVIFSGGDGTLNNPYLVAD